jgi:hypothetical protein
MSLVVNGYLTDFTRLKYISADFVLPWELPERDLNCYRSDYCSETERYIVSESDQKFDWNELRMSWPPKKRLARPTVRKRKL